MESPNQIMMDLQRKQVLVMGAGRSGVAAARLARAHGAAVVLLDNAPEERFEALKTQMAQEEIAFLPGFQEEQWRGGRIDLVVMSPGIAQGSPMDRVALSTKALVMGELEFGAAFLSCPMLAVTGTNGKTTTVELMAACLREAGKRVMAAGNIGLPLSQVALEQPELEYLVVEVSSFQLEHASSFHPLVAVVLNITPDHLNRHGTMEVYRELKLNLLRQVRAGGHAIYHANLEKFVNIPAEVVPDRLWLIGEEVKQGKRGTDWLVNSDGLARLEPDGTHKPLLSRAILQLVGNHNLANALAVVAALSGIGIPLTAYLAAMSNFHSGPHRLQPIAECNGVAFFDDSKATDVDAMKQALKTLGPTRGKKILLIAGGLDKGCALLEVKSELRMYVKEAYLIGDCRQRLAGLWREEIPCRLCDSLEAAVRDAAAMAKPGDTVLLSPGCASMDMFRDYEERGNRFREAVLALSAEDIGKSE
ncbi:MAG: UDP-N-acetylmuramoyl-L-alanine--D-glutamate ligase [Victivallales bacterium]|nr:UDP-N-acetylmuramoyl-L-alanine--D-glutamate ligase [Victivallales bacterium]